MEITETTREEIKALISQTLDEREQQAAANKSVYRRICKDFEQDLKQFDYIRSITYVDVNGVTHINGNNILCSRRIRDAVGALLRVAYQVKNAANLPAEQEDNIRRFMSSILGLMTKLKN